MDFSQCVAITERVGIQGGQRGGKMHAYQAGTTGKCASSNCGYRIRNIRHHQTDALFKSTGIDGRQIFRQRQVPQIGTAVKRTAANGPNVILHDHSTQTRSVLEHIGANGNNGVSIDRSGDGQRSGRSAIAGNGSITSVIQTVSVSNHRLLCGVIAGAVIAAAPVAAPVGRICGGIIAIIVL